MLADKLAGVEATLARSFIINNIYLRDRVISREELIREIASAIGEIRRRMMQFWTNKNKSAFPAMPQNVAQFMYGPWLGE